MIRVRWRSDTPDSGTRALVTGTSWQTLAQVAPLVINLAMTPFIIHGLGSFRYSVFLLVTSIATMLGQFDGGIGQSALRFFTVYVGRDDRAAATRLLVSVAAIIATFGTGIAVLAFLGTDTLLDFFRFAADLRDEAGLLFRTLCVVAGVILLRNLFNSVVIAHHLFRFTAGAVLLGHLIYAAGLVLTVERGWGLYGVAATMVVQQAVPSALTVPVAVRRLDRRGLGWMSRGELAEFFRYAWKVQVSGVTGILNSQKDQLVAGRVLSAQESGPYGQGANFATQLRLLPLNALAPLQATIGQAVGRLGATDAVSKVARLQRIWVRAVTGWCAIGVPATYVGVRHWLPDSFAASADVAAILVAGALFPLSAVVLKVWALSLGRSDLDMRAGLVGLMVNVTASALLYLPFGMLGVVAGTAIGQMASAHHLAWDAHRRLPTRLPWFVRDIPWWQALSGCAAVALCELLIGPHLPRGVFGLLGAGLTALPGAALYAMLTVKLSGLRQVWARRRR